MSGLRDFRPETRRGPGIASPLDIVEGFLNEDLAAADNPLTGATMATGTLIAWMQDAPTTGQDQGDWDADANDPVLASSTGTDGDFYRVSVSGSSLLDNINVWQASQYLQFTGGVWVRCAPVFHEVDAIDDLGDWDANANNPTLSDGVGDELDFYRVSVASATTTLDGLTDWEVGEHLQFVGGVWTRRGPRQVVFLVNRDTTLSGSADDYFLAAKINGEFRLIWLSCSTVRP